MSTVFCSTHEARPAASKSNDGRAPGDRMAGSWHDLLCMPRYTSLRSFIALSGFVGGLGCFTPLDRAENAWATTVCHWWEKCECDEWGSVSDCEASARDDWNRFIERVSEAGLTYDGACMGRLMNAYDRRGCATPDKRRAFEDEPRCPLAYGEVEQGEACDDLFSFHGLTANYRVSDCARGLVCAAGACSKPARVQDRDLGEACDWRATCREGLACRAELCVALPGPGEECPDRECDPRSSFCDSTQTCREPGEIGASCAAQEECVSAYCPNGTCQLPPKKGEPCTFRCADGLFCDGGTCEPPLDEPGRGEVCTY